MNRQQYAKQTLRINKAHETQFFPSVYRVMNIMTTQAVNALKSGGYNAAIKTVSAIVGNPALTERIRAMYRVVGVKQANRVYGMLDKEPRQLKRFGYNAQWALLVIEYLKKYALEELTFSVTENQRDAMIRYLTKGIEDGLGVDEMVKRLQDKESGWPEMLRHRVARIVRTEIKRASEVGSKIASDDFGFEQNKTWISIRDKRSRGVESSDRTDHIHMDGQVVDASGVFTDPRSGEQLAFPGDPKGSAQAVINCRCTVGYVAKRDANGRMIPKRRSTAVIMPGDFNRQRQIVTI